MHANDDDSWEIAAQAALDIHRRTISAVRERVRTGTGRRRKVRPRTATSRSCSDARTRPVSAPSQRVNEERRSCSTRSTNHPRFLVPSLANVPNTTVNEISRVELEAWATLSRNTRRPCESTPTVTSDRAGLNSAYCHYSREDTTSGRGRTTTPAVPWVTDTYHCNPDLFDDGHNSAAAAADVAMATSTEANRASWYKRGARATTLPSAGKFSADPRGMANGTRNVRSYLDGPGHDGRGRQTLARDQTLDGRKMDRAEHDAGHRHQREHQRDRSDISVRLLREHAKKVMKEEKAFLRLLRAEAKAKEDREIEMIHRATQWARDLEKDLLYLPHRVEGKLHVLKVDNGFASARFNEGAGHGGGLRHLEENGRILSVEFFVKGDHARLEKERYAAFSGGTGINHGAAQKFGQKQPNGKRNASSRKSVRDRPDAAETCRELHQLIKDTVGLVEVLTRQATELEGQGWNPPPGGSRTTGRGNTKT